MRPLAEMDSPELETLRQSILLRRNQRVQEIILERIERLPADAHTILNLCAVIGRDFSLDLLERAAAHDPLDALEVLLDRKFLIERPDERLDFSHEVVRQAVYDSLNILQRRRLHLAVAGALVDLHQDNHSPSEVAMHYWQSGASYRRLAAEYSVRAGERLLRTYGFRQAIEAFDRALKTFEELPDSQPEYIRRGLEGMGLAYESLFDAEGVTSTYRKLQTWARKQGDRPLMIATYSRLTTMLGLFGQQSESNVQLRELLRYLGTGDAAGDAGGMPSRVLVDLLERRELIYSRDDETVPPTQRTPSTHAWQPYVPAPRPVTDPVGDLLKILEPVHAVPPLFDYAWTLLVQGELGEATRILESVVDLATVTNQPSIASAAFHQLAVTARILGENEQSQLLNDQSIAINRARPGTAAELGSMWPRIASGFLSLQAGRLDEAERRLRRVADFLSERRSFRNYYNSANIGLGLVALEQGKVEEARRLLGEALVDSVHLYPYTHVHALLGLARIAHLDADMAERNRLLRQALQYAGKRSLLEEYIAIVLEVAHFRPAGVPVGRTDRLRPHLCRVNWIGSGGAAAECRHRALGRRSCNGGHCRRTQAPMPQPRAEQPHKTRKRVACGPPVSLDFYNPHPNNRLQPSVLHVYHRNTFGLEILDLNGVRPWREIVVALNGRGRPNAPVVDDQLVINPDAHAVVDRGPETIVAAVEVLDLGPTHAEVVGANAVARSPRAPVKGNVGILAYEGRRGCQVTIVEILAVPRAIQTAAAAGRAGRRDCRAAAGTVVAGAEVVAAVGAAAGRGCRTGCHTVQAGTVGVVAADASRHRQEYRAAARRKSGSSSRSRWPGQVPRG